MFCHIEMVVRLLAVESASTNMNRCNEINIKLIEFVGEPKNEDYCEEIKLLFGWYRRYKINVLNRPF